MASFLFFMEGISNTDLPHSARHRILRPLTHCSVLRRRSCLSHFLRPEVQGRERFSDDIEEGHRQYAECEPVADEADGSECDKHEEELLLGVPDRPEIHGVDFLQRLVGRDVVQGCEWFRRMAQPREKPLLAALCRLSDDVAGHEESEHADEAQACGYKGCRNVEYIPRVEEPATSGLDSFGKSLKKDVVEEECLDRSGVGEHI